MLIFVIAVLTAWFVLTLIAQFWTVPWVARLKSYDLAEVVPGWSFFAPNPGTSDSELLYRDELVDGELGPWRAVRFARASLLRAVWNPQKRRRKALVDLCSSLLTEAAASPERNAVLIGFPYIAVLSHVSSFPSGPLSKRRQFILARSFSETGKEPEVMFISGWHRL